MLRIGSLLAHVALGDFAFGALTTSTPQRRLYIQLDGIHRARTRGSKSCVDHGNLDLLFKTVAAERRCCEFLRFQITVEPGGGAVTLDLTGPPGTREFVAALFER